MPMAAPNEPRAIVALNAHRRHPWQKSRDEIETGLKATQLDLSWVFILFLGCVSLSIGWMDYTMSTDAWTRAPWPQSTCYACIALFTTATTLFILRVYMGPSAMFMYPSDASISVQSKEEEASWQREIQILAARGFGQREIELALMLHEAEDRIEEQHERANSAECRECFWRCDALCRRF